MIFKKARELERRARLLSRTMSWRDAMKLVAQAKGPARAEQSITFAPLNRPLSLRAGDSDLQCYEKIFVAREYDVPFRIEPTFIVDAGANIGLSTLHFKQQYPSAIVVSIEPEGKNFDLLNRNCGSLPGVHLLNAALWSDDSS